MTSYLGIVVVVLVLAFIARNALVRGRTWRPSDVTGAAALVLLFLSFGAVSVIWEKAGRDSQAGETALAFATFIGGIAAIIFGLHIWSVSPSVYSGGPSDSTWARVTEVLSRLSGVLMGLGGIGLIVWWIVQEITS